MFTWTTALDPFLLPARGQGELLAAKPVADKKLFAVAAEARTDGIAPRDAVAALIDRGSGEGSLADEAELFVIVGSRKGGPSSWTGSSTAGSRASARVAPSRSSRTWSRRATRAPTCSPRSSPCPSSPGSKVGSPTRA
ncbi:MAG: hypothetical protein M3680_16190 [Myxococcota bacterium]|nr:hypothetical protein [Myxococcota bacterium]